MIANITSFGTPFLVVRIIDSRDLSRVHTLSCADEGAASFSRQIRRTPYDSHRSFCGSWSCWATCPSRILGVRSGVSSNSRTTHRS